MAHHEYARMHADRSFNDVEIKSASEDGVIPAHKVVLATASSTLRKMLLSEMVEAKKSQINIQASFNSTKVFVKYMYTYDRSELNSVSDFMLVELYHLSIFYDVAGLERDCRDRMESNLKLSNLTEFLFIAEKYKIEKLTKKCLAIIDEQALKLRRTYPLLCLPFAGTWCHSAPCTQRSYLSTRTCHEVCQLEAYILHS